MNGVIESFNKIFPNNIARLILDDIKLDLSNYTNNLVRHINKINCIYFSQTGEVWILHTIPEFNDDYGPFLFPLVYQHCADIQMIIVDLDILEHYSELVKNNLLTLYKKYGYGLCTFDNDNRSDKSTKVIQLPLVQFMLPDVRDQLEEYLTTRYHIALRKPIWIGSSNQEFELKDVPELLEYFTSTTEQKNK